MVEKSVAANLQLRPLIMCKHRKFPYALGTQIRTVLSFEADAKTSPSGENLTSVTTPFEGVTIYL